MKKRQPKNYFAPMTTKKPKQEVNFDLLGFLFGELKDEKENLLKNDATRNINPNFMEYLDPQDLGFLCKTCTTLRAKRMIKIETWLTQLPNLCNLCRAAKSNLPSGAGSVILRT